MEKYLSLLLHRKIDEAEIYRKDSIPSKLTKFFSLTDNIDTNEKKLETLKNEKLWFSAPKVLNDPYEFQCMYVNRKKLKEFDYPDYILNFFGILLNKQTENTALVSLSGNSFNCLPMWAYYTNNYRGYCVEYDVTVPDMIFKVAYEPERIPVASIISNFFNGHLKIVKNERVHNKDIDFYTILIRQQFFLKHKSWEHENEYRIILASNEAKGLSIDIAKIGLKTKRIVAGLKCPDEYKKRLNYISNKLGCGDISVSKISGNKYVLLEELDNL